MSKPLGANGRLLAIVEQCEIEDDLDGLFNRCMWRLDIQEHWNNRKRNQMAAKVWFIEEGLEKIKRWKNRSRLQAWR